MPTGSSYVQANTNGRLHDARESSVAPLNRGFLYGDAVYEVWRTYHGTVFAWEQHWRRLEHSAAALHLELPLDASACLGEIRRTVTAYLAAGNPPADLYVRLQITRGAGALGLDPALADRSDYLLLVQPNRPHSEAKLTHGLVLSLATTLRRNPADSLNPAWKTGNYLNNILCLREARARGADDVVIQNRAGEVTESAVSNIGFVRGGEILTPPLSAGILGGITRELVLGEIAPRAGLVAREHTVMPDEFATMDECFLLSSTKDITPVRAIDAVNFKVGPDTVTARLKTAFTDYAREYAAQHPRLRLLQ